MTASVPTYGTAELRGINPFETEASKKKQNAMEKSDKINKTDLATQVAVASLTTIPPVALVVGIAYAGSKLLDHLFTKTPKTPNEPNYQKLNLT